MKRQMQGLFCLLLIASCLQRDNTTDDSPIPLYEPPQKVRLNLKEGYAVNPFTGDSIPHLNNYLGETIKTGVPIQVKGVSTLPAEAAPPLLIKTDPAKEIQFRSEVQLIPEKLVQYQPNVSTLYAYTSHGDSARQIVLNNYGDTIVTANPIMIPETYQTFIPSPPVPAQLMRMRDQTAYDIQYLSPEQGLPSSTVKGILEDRHGNIWMGTDVGVSWFDGTYFRHYPTKETPRLNITNTILEDKKGNIWFGTLDGIVCMNEKGYFWISEQQGHLFYNGIFSILEDSKGNIWVGMWQGMVLRYEPSIQGDTGRLTHFQLMENPQPGMISEIVEDQYGQLWFGTTRDGLFRYNGKQFLQFTTDSGLPGNAVWTMCPDRNGQLWIGTAKGACLYRPGPNGSIGTFTHLTSKEGLIHDNVKSITVGDDNTVWFGTWGGGVSCLREVRQNGVPRKVIYHYTDKEGLSSKLIHKVFEDKNQNIWVTTGGGGINVIRHGSFEHILDVEGIPNLIIRSIYEDRYHNIWIGTEGSGITTISNKGDISSSTLRHYTSTEKFVIRWTCDIIEDRLDQLWFGSTAGMMKLASPRDGEQLLFNHYSSLQGFTDAFVMCITPDALGNLWFGTFGGGLIQAILSETGEIKEFVHFTEDQGFSANYIVSVVADDKNNLWVETDINGVCYLELTPDRKAGTMTVYSEREGLLSNHLSCMYMDPKGDLWLGTEQKGVCQLLLSNPEKEMEFISYTMDQGLPDNNIKEIVPFPGNASDRPFWVTTKGGLGLILPHTTNDSITSLFSYGRTEGLKQTEFTYRNGVIDHHQHVWFGTVKGLQILKLKEFQYPINIPKPHLQQITVNEKLHNYHNLPDSVRKTISFESPSVFENLPLNPVFSYKNNHLTFYFSAPDWSAPYRVLYSYKIENVNETWSLPSRETKADYRNLPYGTHTFKVRAIGESQQWSEPFQYSFTISPPWWYSWWAFTMYGVLGGFVLYRTYRYQLNRKFEIADRKRLVELDQIKNRLYTNITHEFRTPLTLIHGPVSLALSTRTPLDENDVKSIHRQSERLQQLITQMLDLQKIEAGKMKTHFVYGEIVDKCRYILSLFESWAKEKNITLDLVSAQEEIWMDLDEEKLTQINSNLISNAIRHTSAKGNVQMALNVLQAGKMLEITFQDSGIGIGAEDLPYIFDRFYQSSRAASGGTGIGLSLTKMLVELLGGTIQVDSTPNVGTTFTLRLPITANAIESITADQKAAILRPHHYDDELKFMPPVESISDKPIALIVEDHPEVAQFVASCLKNDFSTMLAHNGDEGIQKAFEHIPDLVISDVMMPGKDGFELCAILKKDIQTSHIPVILLTGRGDHAALMEGIEHGADAYVVKPFEPQELILRAQKLLELRAKLSAYYKAHATNQQTSIPVETSPKENVFLQKIRSFVEEHISDPQFNMHMLCQHMAMSHPQLHRKITALTGESTGKFVRTIRLTKAIELLKHSDLTVSEIAYETGFSEPGYFTKIFSKEFHLTPTEYRTRMA